MNKQDVNIRVSRKGARLLKKLAKERNFTMKYMFDIIVTYHEEARKLHAVT